MSFDFSQNRLLLNPRLAESSRAELERAWRELVIERFATQSNATETYIGIATSGSSGDPRGRLIVLTRSALLASAAAVNAWFASHSDDVWMKTLPSFHVGGLGILLRAELSGSRVVESSSSVWSPSEFHQELVSSRATLLSLVPTQLFDLVHLDLRAPQALRAVIIGGGRLEEGLHLRALEMGWPILTSYGLTECCSQVATELPTQAEFSRALSDRPRLRLLPHVAVRTRADGRLEIQSRALLRAQIVFTASGPQLIEHIPGEWFCTEDHGRVASDGALEIEGRSVDFVKIGGESVIVSRLEQQLERKKTELGFHHLGEAVVLAAADARLGAVMVLLTTTSASVSQPLVDAFNQSVLPFERIRSVHSLEKLPRSELGKLLRAAALSAVGLSAP